MILDTRSPQTEQRPKHDEPQYTPTPAEIEAECKRIREAWDDNERKSRRTRNAVE